MKSKIPFICGLAILIIIAFSPTLQHANDVWDDEVHLTKNKDVRSLSPANVQKIFTHTVNKTYIPLTTLSFAVEYHFFRYQPFIYHFTNIFLHAMVTILIFFLGLRLGLSTVGSLIAAVLFGIHPLRVESVAWVTERKDVLYATFYLSAVYAHCVYVKSRSKWIFLMTMFFGLMSVLTKAMALSLPLILLLCDWFLKREMRLQVWLEKIFHCLYIVPIVWMTYSLNARMPIHHLGESFLVWVWTFIFYLRKFFLPFELIPLYDLPKPVALANPEYGGAIAALILLTIVIVRWRNNRWLMLAVLYYFGSIFFLLRYDDVVDVNIVADRFMYLPSLGICFLLGKWSERFWCSPTVRKQGLGIAVIAGGVILLMGLSFKTFQQCKIWKDDFILWSYVLSKEPNSFRAHFSLGQEYYQRGNPQEAWRHYQETLRLNPTYAKALNNVGEMLYAQGKSEEAMSYFERAVFSLPDYMQARNNYGAMLMGKGRLDEAKTQIEEAILLDRESPFAYMNLGDLFFHQSRWDEALQNYEEALRVSPNDPKALNRLGAVYLQRKDLGKAADYFREALLFNPQDANAKHNLAVTMQHLGP